MSIDLTKKQWAEIYYALDTKVHLIKEGFYGPEEEKGQNKKWIQDLSEIMTQISDEVDV